MLSPSLSQISFSPISQFFFFLSSSQFLLILNQLHQEASVRGHVSCKFYLHSWEIMRQSRPQSSYLSQISKIIFLGKNLSCGVLGKIGKCWRKFGKFRKILRNFGKFTRFHVEKNWAQKIHLWRKMTNMRSPRPWPVWQLVWGPCSSAQWGRPVPEWRTWDGCTKCTSALSSIEIATSPGWADYSQLCE